MIHIFLLRIELYKMKPFLNHIFSKNFLEKMVRGEYMVKKWPNFRLFLRKLVQFQENDIEMIHIFLLRIELYKMKPFLNHIFSKNFLEKMVRGEYMVKKWPNFR